jgi:hypothetical protein
MGGKVGTAGGAVQCASNLRKRLSIAREISMAIRGGEGF